jgi:hypothetical protein
MKFHLLLLHQNNITSYPASSVPPFPSSVVPSGQYQSEDTSTDMMNSEPLSNQEMEE